MVVKKRKTAESWKKKEWYSLLAPQELEEKPIGSTPADKPESVIGRGSSVSLRDITGNMNHQFVKLHLRVKDVKGKNAYTELVGFELVREYLRRNVRRRRSMIRAVQTLRTSDGRTARITSYIFTARKIDSSKKSIMRHELMRVTANAVSKETFVHAVEKCIFGQIAGEVFSAIKNIAPVRRVEIYKITLYEPPKKENEKPKTVAEEPAQQ